MVWETSEKNCVSISKVLIKIVNLWLEVYSIRFKVNRVVYLPNLDVSSIYRHKIPGFGGLSTNKR